MVPQKVRLMIQHVENPVLFYSVKPLSQSRFLGIDSLLPLFTPQYLLYAVSISEHPALGLMDPFLISTVLGGICWEGAIIFHECLWSFYSVGAGIKNTQGSTGRSLVNLRSWYSFCLEPAFINYQIKLLSVATVFIYDFTSAIEEQTVLTLLFLFLPTDRTPSLTFFFFFLVETTAVLQKNIHAFMVGKENIYLFRIFCANEDNRR